MSDLPRHSVRNMGNPGQGTAFHELVVVPTFTPELVRPYQVPGGDLIIHPQVPQGGIPAGPVAASGASSSAQIDPSLLNANDDVEKHLLYIHVTLEWTERSGKSTRNNARSKKMHESKLVSTAVDVVSTSRVAFVPIALGAHGYADAYVAGIASGPGMRIFWTGSPGGKGGATVVLSDQDWQIVVQKLGAVMKASKRLDTISIIFNLDEIEGWKQRKRIHSPDAYESELTYGSRVPNTENCTPAQVALGGAIDEIKTAHSCVEHGGTCFIDGDLHHMEMNRFRLGMWGQAVLAGKCEPTDPPPQDLVTSWNGGTSSTLSKPKPRGRSGPNPVQQAASSSTSDTTNLLLTTMVPVMAMMAQNMASNISAPAPAAPASASHVFMDTFRRAKNIADTRIDNAKDQLRDASYTPDIICEPSVTSERLMELTGFAEGEVHRLKKFARQWSGKMEGKRARRGISF
ncbi:hypothetical protein DFH08DRAFT_957872 [Mycena albidolilacea]|uniref:Uncharacterized protein n=1 Tax=Mycena albidolilacea TaxID=1033008 RepID=A0AAD7A850_9AGAR|nr:hypothetical protein DFH08DRAFT_957872 [Mycena albidolilacea]